MKFFNFLRDWSEVWPLLIPLIITIIYRPMGRAVNWLILYVFIAFIINFWAIFTLEYYYLLPKWMYRSGNNLFYNLHSFIMVVFFGWYLVTVRSYKYQALLKGLIILYVIFVLANFIFLEPVNRLSTRHFTIGSVLLLVVCLSYYFRSILEESNINWLKHPSFIICSGICLYQAITFFIFLFIYPLYNSEINRDLSFAFLMMRIYQVAFILFCISLAIGLYQYRSSKKLTINVGDR